MGRAAVWCYFDYDDVCVGFKNYATQELFLITEGAVVGGRYWLSCPHECIGKTAIELLPFADRRDATDC